MVVVIGNVTHSVRMYRVARETAIATSVAEAKLTAAVHSKDSIRPGSDGGTVTEDPRFTYRVTIDEATLPGFEKEDLPGIYRAEVVVQWDCGTPREVRLVQLLSGEGEPK